MTKKAFSKLLALIVAAVVVIGGVSVYYYYSLHYSLPSTSHPQYKTITDFEGRSHYTICEVERAVILEGYEIVYALGVWDKVVGLSKYAEANPILIAADEKYGLNLSNIPSPGSSFNVNFRGIN